MKWKDFEKKLIELIPPDSERQNVMNDIIALRLILEIMDFIRDEEVKEILRTAVDTSASILANKEVEDL